MEGRRGDGKTDSDGSEEKQTRTDRDVLLNKSDVRNLRR